jgi:hypothetical protein
VLGVVVVALGAAAAFWSEVLGVVVLDEDAAFWSVVLGVVVLGVVALGVEGVVADCDAL